MQRLLLVALFLFLTGPLQAQATGLIGDRDNFLACREGDDALCDPGLLSESQRETVELAAQRRNVQACIRGSEDCRPDRLTETQRYEVDEERYSINYSLCLAGEPGCRWEQLSSAQQLKPEERANERNLASCMEGGLCDADRLSARQRTEVEITLSQRNFQDCVARDPNCDRSALTESQRNEVDRRLAEQNLNACIRGDRKCDYGALTEEQRAVVDRAERRAAQQAATPQVVYVQPRQPRLRTSTYLGVNVGHGFRHRRGVSTGFGVGRSFGHSRFHHGWHGHHHPFYW